VDENYCMFSLCQLPSGSGLIKTISFIFELAYLCCLDNNTVIKGSVEKAEICHISPFTTESFHQAKEMVLC